MNVHLDLTHQSDGLKIIKKYVDSHVQILPNPVFLMDYALSQGKNAQTIDKRHHNLAPAVFSHCVNDFFDVKITKAPRKIDISVKELGKFIFDAVQEVQTDYDVFKTRENILNSIEKKYIEFFDQYSKELTSDMLYAGGLIIEDDGFVEYLLREFSRFKNIAVDEIVNRIVCNHLTLATEFGTWSGINYINPILKTALITIELNALKEINNQQNCSKAFLFTGAVHAKNLDGILLECGYERIYTYISTSLEIVEKLQASGINVMVTEAKELKPVSPELLKKLGEKELTRELFEETAKLLELNKDVNSGSNIFTKLYNGIYEFFTLKYWQ